MHKKSLICLFITLILSMALLFSACGNAQNPAATPQASSEAAEQVTEAAPSEPAVNDSGLEDGVYIVDVDTGSNMFHVNEAKDGKGELTVENGKMTLHITLASKNILNLFVGTSEEAAAEGAVLLEPTVDEVTYSDGITDEAYGFDIPVPYLNEPFDVSIIGTHGNWYTHPVTVTNPVKAE